MIPGSITDHADRSGGHKTLTNRGFIAKMLGQYCTGWAYGYRLVGERKFSVPGFAAGRVEYDPGSLRRARSSRIRISCQRHG